MKRTERKGIVVGGSDYEIGYWARYNNDLFEQLGSAEWRAGWNACDEEIRSERRDRREARSEMLNYRVPQPPPA